MSKPADKFLVTLVMLLVMLSSPLLQAQTLMTEPDFGKSDPLHGVRRLRLLPAMPGGTQLVNGDFESGPGIGWEEYSLLEYALIVPREELPYPISPHQGDYVAWLGGDNNEESYIFQDVTVTSQTPLLGYWHWITSLDVFCDYDYAQVWVNEDLLIQYDLCSSKATGGWVKKSIDLSGYIGQNITLKMEVETDSSSLSNLFLDDVLLEADPFAQRSVYLPLVVR